MQDVCIIGAGPAGSVAAIVLARGGWDVTLVEQQRFPRDKVCGECISCLGIELLHRLGLASAVLPLRPALLRESVLVSVSGEQTEFALPRSMWGVSRRNLDHVLLERARQVGAKVLQPARVEALHDDQLTLRDLLTNRLDTLRPRHVFLADGKGALGGNRPPPTGDFGVKAHFIDVEDVADAITLFGLNGHYIGLAPIEEARWNVAMSVPSARLNAFRGRLDELFEHLKQENLGLARRFRRATRVSDWLVAPLPRFAVQRRWPANVIPIGNAAAALEPIGGEGIGLAMRSAELAATALLEGRPSESLQRSFNRLWRTRRGACRLIAKALGRPAVAESMIALTRANEHLAKTAMAFMGKS